MVDIKDEGNIPINIEDTKDEGTTPITPDSEPVAVPLTEAELLVERMKNRIEESKETQRKIKIAQKVDSSEILAIGELMEELTIANGKIAEAKLVAVEKQKTIDDAIGVFDKSHGEGQFSFMLGTPSKKVSVAKSTSNGVKKSCVAVMPSGTEYSGKASNVLKLVCDNLNKNFEEEKGTDNPIRILNKFLDNGDISRLDKEGYIN